MHIFYWAEHKSSLPCSVVRSGPKQRPSVSILLLSYSCFDLQLLWLWWVFFGCGSSSIVLPFGCLWCTSFWIHPHQNEKELPSWVCFYSGLWEGWTKIFFLKWHLFSRNRAMFPPSLQLLPILAQGKAKGKLMCSNISIQEKKISLGLCLSSKIIFCII